MGTSRLNMKKLYRLVSSDDLEIYNLKESGELLFCKSVNPTKFNFRKIRHLIISACFTNWDTKRIENIAYKPNSKMNMFASQSIYEKDKVFITLPYKFSNTDYWTQAWAPKNRLSPFLKTISKKIKIYPEALTINGPKKNTYWKSGPLILNSNNRSDFININFQEEFNHNISKNLNGFIFEPSIEFIIFKKKKPIGLIFSIFILIMSIIFIWFHSLNEIILEKNNPPTLYENNISGMKLLEIIQSSIPDGVIQNIKFDQRTDSTTYTFLSNQNAFDFFNLASEFSDTLNEWEISNEANIVTFIKKRDN